jgi:hypothetical protein
MVWSTRGSYGPVGILCVSSSQRRQCSANYHGHRVRTQRRLRGRQHGSLPLRSGCLRLMSTPRDNGPDSPDGAPQAVESGSPREDASRGPKAPAIGRESSLDGSSGRVLLLVAGVAAALAVALITGAVALPGASHRKPSTQTDEQASLASSESTANIRWASATCTNILAWKNAIQRDTKGLNLNFASLGRIEDAVAATTRVLNQIKKLGPPPAVRTAQARAEIGQFRADVASRVRTIQGDVHSVAGGNLAAIGTLVGDLGNAKVLGTEIGNELRVVFADLGLPLAATPACRQLAGIAV